MSAIAHSVGQPSLTDLLYRRRRSTPTSFLTWLASPAVYAALVADVTVAHKEPSRPLVVPLNGGGSSSSSSTGVIVGCVVAIAGTILVTAFVVLLCLVYHRRRYRHLRYGRSHVYTDADSVALQDDHSHDGAHHPQHGGRGAGQHEGTETVGRHSRHTVEGNEPVTPSPQLTTPQMRDRRDRRDNYADRFEPHANNHEDDDEGYEADDGVRPASPTAERVEGVAIENRVHPHRNLPRGQVVIHHGNQDICLDFRGVQRVPQAGPPPLTFEERQRLIDAQNRVASPEFYGRAEYEHRSSSNTSTPNMLLSSSLLRELQQQYAAAAASASGQLFPSYASEAGYSIGSVSFRPGSPAGSARRGRRDGRQSTSPSSVSIGGQNLRHRKNGSRQHTGSRDASAGHNQQHASIPRHHREDLESTSDDFEDFSLHNDSFTARREKLRDASDRLVPPSAAFPACGVSLGSDQMSLRSNSPGAFERFASAPGSVSGGAALNSSTMSGFGVPSPLDHPQDPPAAQAHAPQGPRSSQSTWINSPVTWSATASRSPPYQTVKKLPPALGSERRSNAHNSNYNNKSRSTNGNNNNNNNNNAAMTGSRNTTSTPSDPARSPRSSTASPEILPTLLVLSPSQSPSSPPNSIVQFLGVTSSAAMPQIGRIDRADALERQQQHQQQQQSRHHSGLSSAALATPVFSVDSGAATTLDMDSRATVSGVGDDNVMDESGLQPRHFDASLGLRSDASHTSLRREGAATSS
ncbi:hypothetical protein NQL31_004000 [Lotmaria passim]